MKKEIDEINILKGIGILAVLIGHSTMFLFIKDMKYLNIYIYAFHMPLFFMISGFFAKSIYSKDEILKVIKRLYIPFLIFIAFNSILVPLLVQIPTYIRSSELYPIKYDLFDQILKLAKGIFFARHEDILGTGLWFLPTLTLAKMMWIFLNEKLRIPNNVFFITILLFLNILLYNILKDHSLFFWMWPVAIMAYFFMNIGKYYYQYNIQAKLSNFDILILLLISSSLIILNGRVDMSIYRFHNIILFIVDATISLIVLHRLSQIIDNKSILIKKFLIFSGKHSLAIFLIHPFLLAIIPYVLIANFNVKNVYENPFWLLLIYCVILLIVYIYNIVTKLVQLKINH